MAIDAAKVGLAKLNPAHPQLESACFQPADLSSPRTRFQTVAFYTRAARRYAAGVAPVTIQSASEEAYILFLLGYVVVIFVGGLLLGGGGGTLNA
jgi:hypothetical protein